MSFFSQLTKPKKGLTQKSSTIFIFMTSFGDGPKNRKKTPLYFATEGKAAFLQTLL